MSTLIFALLQFIVSYFVTFTDYSTKLSHKVIDFKESFL